MPDTAINPSINVLNTIHSPVKRVLFLGYSAQQTSIITALMQAGCEVHHTDEKLVNPLLSQPYDFSVSFGYRHIISSEVLAQLDCPVFNLHIAYLPYNRGAHPNFWSFYDGTPAGVTIHIIDEGIDTGPIVRQKKVLLDPEENTFAQTYACLIEEIETLFIHTLDDLVHDCWIAKPQAHNGSMHFLRDLPDEFAGWHCNIKAEICRLHTQLGTD